MKDLFLSGSGRGFLRDGAGGARRILGWRLSSQAPQVLRSSIAYATGAVCMFPSYAGVNF